MTSISTQYIYTHIYVSVSISKGRGFIRPSCMSVDPCQSSGHKIELVLHLGGLALGFPVGRAEKQLSMLLLTVK